MRLHTTVFSIFCLCFLMLSIPVSAQERSMQAAPPSLTGHQRSVLVQIAREAIDATLENRESRTATVEPRLTAPQPIVISVYVDDKLRGRAWRLKSTSPLFENARIVTYEAIDKPKAGGEMLSLEELARARVSVAVLSNYTKAADDRDIPPKSAVIIYNGFTEWLALSGDIESDKASDLLSYACEQAGLRPNIWLLPQTTIFWAEVEEAGEIKADPPKLPLGDL